MSSSKSNPRVILASKSPRRHALLKALGIAYRVVEPSATENNSCKTAPKRLVKNNALRKAQSVAQRFKSNIIISADTLVVVGKKIFAKPRNIYEAKRMLRNLSGRTHIVYTGVCVLDTSCGKTFLDAASTKVSMLNLTNEQIHRYVYRRMPLDKAGGYAVQDLEHLVIDRIEGSLSNVIGLPLNIVERYLRKCKTITT